MVIRKSLEFLEETAVPHHLMKGGVEIEETSTQIPRGIGQAGIDLRRGEGADHIAREKEIDLLKEGGKGHLDLEALMIGEDGQDRGMIIKGAKEGIRDREKEVSSEGDPDLMRETNIGGEGLRHKNPAESESKLSLK